MDKQQAAEAFSKQEWQMFDYRHIAKTAYIAGWEACEAQFPTDAAALQSAAKNIVPGDDAWRLGYNAGKIRQLMIDFARIYSPQAAGPVWVNCTERMPEDTKRPKPPKQIFVKWLHSGEFESGGRMTVNQLVDRIKGNIYDKDFQWLDESNTQQVFIREVVERMLLDLARDIRAGKASTLQDVTEWFNSNYPPSK